MPQHAFHNRILLALPRESLARLQRSLTQVLLSRGQSIDQVGATIRHLYFVDQGFVSMIKTMADGRSVEVGGVGNEGLTDVNALLGIDTAVLDTVVQIPGRAYRIRRTDLQEALANDPAFREIIHGYARYLFGQIAQTAACNRLHSVEQRCCRWLLIAQDSAQTNPIPLTHEFLATMLGAERAGVSRAARALKSAGFIDYTRGSVTVLNRAALESRACECYATMQDALARLFGSGRVRARQ